MNNKNSVMVFIQQDDGKVAEVSLELVCKAKELAGAEVLWFWGDLLDNPRGYPLIEQVIKYAYSRRGEMFVGAQ